MRAWWDREIDPARMVSAVGFLTAICLWVVAFAAADFTLLDGAPWSAAGATLGISIRAFVDHRSPSAARGFAWAIAYAAAMFVFFLALIGSVMVLRPMLQGVPVLGDGWEALFAAGFVIGGLSAVLWERSRAGRVGVGLTLVGMGLLFAGLAGLVGGQPLLGALALPTSIVLLVLGLTKGVGRAPAAIPPDGLTSG
jgi:hypothetical protein